MQHIVLDICVGCAMLVEGGCDGCASVDCERGGCGGHTDAGVQLRCSRCIQRMAKRRSERRELCDSDRAELRIGRSELECRAV